MQQVKLNIVPDGANPIVYASQFDNGRTVRFNLIDCSAGYEDTWVLGYGDTAEAKLVKPDGTQVIASVTTYPLKNYVDMTLTRDDVDQSGVYIGEIAIHSLDNIYGSLNFTLKVEFDPYDGQGVRTVSIGPADICTFETNIIDNLVDCKCSILASGGNGTPATPIPIVGHSELNLVRCGKNLFDKSTTIDDNWINSSGSAVYFAGGFYSALIPVKPDTAYYLSNVIGGNDFVSSVHYDSDMNVIGAKNVSGSSIQSGSITTFNNSAYMRINSNTANKDTVMVSEGSTPSEYEPYNGTPYLVSFGQTVYGGVYDANSGNVRITHGFSPISSSWTWAKSGSYPGSFYAEVTNVGAKANTPFICSHARTVTSLSDYAEGCCYCDGSINIRIMTADTTVQQWKDYIDAQAQANTPIQICYELATPIEIDVSELSVDTIVGVNNVFADTGETELKYLIKG